ncbi:MAG: excinuclease ABC subunit UvrA, partial [Ignavibacteriaceae bacterium]|nr:excinuclease ABC subunit UvrA [Ignavibacteriaceae bacterium]
MEKEFITIKGAREHNLKNIDLDIPRDTFTVITGLSGSGKSSLAFDTIYAEGQRRYIESLSAYARQFLDMLEKPDVDLIEGLSPAISIEQKSTTGNPRSTVGTVTEIYDYLRLLFARVGIPHCYNCGKPVKKQSSSQIIDSIISTFKNKKISVLSPLIRGRKGHYKELFEEVLSDGFLSVRVDGEVSEITKGFQVDRYKIHNIEIVVDRFTVNESARSRITESVEVALNYGEGSLIVHDGKDDHIFNRQLACIDCGISYTELAPNSFSFNSPYGSCKDCEGLGEKKELDINLIIPDWDKTINEEGLAPVGKPRKIWFFTQLEAVAKIYKFDFDTPLKKLSESQKEVIINGSKERISFTYTYGSGKPIQYMHRFSGIIKYLKHYYDTTSSNGIREWVEAYMNTINCSTCNGGRLRKESLAVKFNGKNISEITSLSILRTMAFFKSVKLKGNEALISKPILKEVNERLEFLHNVGLDYLTLGRSARTLSGGESQRIRLATQIGTQLAGVLYVLDEPSIGLHQSDNIKLINSLKNLRDLGNTIIVVEHDRETIESSDYMVDLGPGAGEQGGNVILDGETKKLLNSDNGFDSLTLSYLRSRQKIKIPEVRRTGSGKYISLKGAKGNNLQKVNLNIPLGTLTLITGVSGSGKSSLAYDVLFAEGQRRFLDTLSAYDRSRLPQMKRPGVQDIKGLSPIINIEQKKGISNPRSTIGTITDIGRYLRLLYSVIG